MLEGSAPSQRPHREYAGWVQIAMNTLQVQLALTSGLSAFKAH